MFENSEKSTYKKMQKKHKDFLKVLEKNLGLVATSCVKFGIDRQTFYNWKEQIEGFKDEVERIDEKLIDFTESQLFKKINEGSEAAIFFHLKCKAKKRGYIERQEIEHSGEMLINTNDLTNLTDEELRRLSDGKTTK